MNNTTRLFFTKVIDTLLDIVHGIAFGGGRARADTPIYMPKRGESPQGQGFPG